MKKLFYVLAIAVIVTACNSKDKNEPEDQTHVSFAKATYFEAVGTNTVPNVEGEQKDQPFSLENVRVEAVIVTDSTLDINLYGINFSSKMPVTIDMVIPGAKYTRSAEKITLYGDSIIPTMGGNPFDRYVINALAGIITVDSLVFTNSYGQYAGCTYAGNITKMEEK
jgi:hypothetical protein